MVPAGNKAKRLSSVNHTTKTIHHKVFHLLVDGKSTKLFPLGKRNFIKISQIILEFEKSIGEKDLIQIIWIAANILRGIKFADTLKMYYSTNLYSNCFYPHCYRYKYIADYVFH